MSKPDESGDDADVYAADAYSADHDPVEDFPEAGAGEDAILGSGRPNESGEDQIGLSEDHRDHTSPEED